MFHNPAHSSGKITDRTIRQRYVWPDMHRDIAKWCKNCIECQQAKVSRHVKLTPEHFVPPDGRFDQVHIDIVGPLPPSEGYSYCLTMIDRFSRWTEATPLKDISAQTIARAFYDTWISRYGTPRLLTTDQGPQFESCLFAALLSLIGCERIRTTSYHPASNGMIERWHRVLKAAIMCHADVRWTRTLSTILLGLRSHVRADKNASPAEFMFGTTLRLPGEFFLPDDYKPDPNYFLEEFREYMRQVRPVPVAHKHKKRVFYFKDLYNCTHVFLRNVAKKAL
ncbi:gag-pol protein [Lasius niger]|uniref:Gag-pol protein n=1 Tax=Lasius niger TaxID=67767 RepID=A0A0J7JXW7_LASNI|nr:gag-pol protein [Lasius niger]